MWNYGNLPFGVLVLPLPYKVLYPLFLARRDSQLCLPIPSGYLPHQMSHLWWGGR